MTNRGSIMMSRAVAAAVLALILSACSGNPPVSANQIVYKAGSSIPETFNLEITPVTDGNYLVDGKTVSIRDIYWKIRGSRHTEKAVNTVLYHNSGGTVMQYMCVIAVIYDWKIAGYQETKGVIRPISVLGDSSGFQIFYNQCMSSIGAH